MNADQDDNEDQRLSAFICGGFGEKSYQLSVFGPQPKPEVGSTECWRLSADGTKDVKH
ncbi:MAG: hypothetical protein ACE14M_16910 [Terriglobales bacterium]